MKILKIKNWIKEKNLYYNINKMSGIDLIQRMLQIEIEKISKEIDKDIMEQILYGKK